MFYARRLSRGLVMLAGGTMTMSLAAPAHAEQFTFFDFVYEATTANTHDAHFDVRSTAEHMLTQPDSWTAPIDYTAGTVYIYQEVMTKPSMMETQLDICFLTGGYGCLNTNHYFTTGTYLTVNAVKDFWNFGMIKWSGKIPLVQLIIKDKNNKNGGAPVSAFMPSKMRIAMTFVTKGDAYKPLPNMMTPMNVDGGATTTPPAADAAAPVGNADAGAEPPEPDAASVTPPTSRPDAGATTTPPATRADAAPSTTPPTTKPEPEPEETPPPRPASGGCTVTGGATSGFALLAAALAIAALRRRRAR
jgi:MYXO-CTERM domain-containing protein